MNRNTLIKALVAGGATIAAILLSDNENVKTKFGKFMDVADDVEKAIKNPLGSLASSIKTTNTDSQMDYYSYMNKRDEREWEMKKLRLQQEHELKMADKGLYPYNRPEDKTNES